MMNWKIRKPTPQEELCYSLEARPYATQEVALKWFSIEGNITSNPKQNAVRNMRNYIKRHRDLQEALAREGYRSYMRSLSPVLVQLIKPLPVRGTARTCAAYPPYWYSSL